MFNPVLKFVRLQPANVSNVDSFLSGKLNYPENRKIARPSKA